MRIESVHQLIASAQTQHFNEGGNVRHNTKIRVPCTSFVDNHVFGKRVLPVSHDQRVPHYLLPLSLYFCWTHGIPLIIQDFPAWRLQPQTLVAGKIFAALEVPQIFVVTMSQHRNVLLTNTAKKWLGFIATSAGPVTKNCPTSVASQVFFIFYVLSDRDRGRGSRMSLSSPLVSLVSPNRGIARDGLRSTCSN